MDEAPPGQDAIKIIPILNSSGIFTKLSKNQAINGCIISWARVPMIIDLGSLSISLKFESFSSNPMQNIRKIRIGIIINSEFIL